MGELIFCGFLCIFFSVMLCAGWLTTNVYLGDETVRIYPCAVLAVIVVCLVLHCINLYKQLSPEEKKKNIIDVFALRKKNTWKLLITIAVTTLYFFLLDIVGYVILTPLIAVWYMAALGEKNWLRMILVALLLTAGVYCIFVYGLEIRLPRGSGAFREFSLTLEYLFR